MILSDFYVCGGNAQLFHTKIVSRRLSRQSFSGWTELSPSKLLSKDPENEACSRKLHDIHFFVLFIFEQICERNMFSKRLVLSQRGCRAAFFGLQNVQRGFATSSGIVLCSFYWSIPVNQYFLPRLVEGRLNVHDLLFASKADIVIGDVYFTLFALRSL